MKAPSTMSRVLLAAVVLVCCVIAVHADTYMHMMRGGNNRLNEPGFERNNGARLWDSQNNNRGGYNVGSMHRPYYFEGSILPIEWTQQHMCGDVNGNNCEMILQYTCGDELTRDGTTTNTIPIDPKQCTTAPNGDCDQMTQYGRHESVASYQACRYRTRNMGLFTSNQYLRNNQIGGPGLSARFTRQNNNGGRSGLECPEERDYYPYWHPTIWRDIAVLTNKVSRCEAYRAESQNVLDRYYCQWDVNDPTFQALNAKSIEGMVPITQAECERPPAGMIGGVWTRVPAWGLDPPDCRQNAYTRDNHLGNAMPADPTKSDTRGYTNMYNWTLPSIEGEINTAYCVLRLRYNISTGEYPFQGYQSDSDVDPGENGLTSAYNLVPVDGQTQVDTNARVPDQFPVWADYRMTKDENAGSWTLTVQNADPNDNNGGRLGGIRKSIPPSRDYTLRNNPQVDLFGSLLPKNVSAVDGYNGQPMIRVRLAINTAQYGRVFQDRSHVFEIRRRPLNMRGYPIYNLSVRGKKGNIVQTYPGVEYDFTPDRLFVNQGDFVHIQWTGSTPSDGTADGNGANGDRHNLVMLNNRQYVEVGQDPTTAPQNQNPPIVGQLGSAYPALINDTTQYPPFLGLDWQRLRMLALFGLNSSTFDLGPVQATAAGEYRYMCTRNNAFSNRSQKGTIVVRPNPSWQALGEDGLVSAPMPVSLYGWTQSESGKAKLVQPNWDGTAVIPGSVNVAETDEADWFVVNPPLMDIGVPDQTLYFEATRPQSSNLFMKGTMMWKLNQNDSAVELIPISGFYDSKNKYMVQAGGFYKSTSTINSAMVAGITLGCVAAIALIVFLYWKVRVQPHGGWKAFYAKMRAGKGAAGKEQNIELLGTGNEPATVSSSSPQVVPAVTSA